MKQWWKRLLCTFVGHNITEHHAYGNSGWFFCARCRKYYEYYEDARGWIVENEMEVQK